MSPINIKTSTKVTINGIEIDDVIEEAKKLAHTVLEELSI